MNRRIALYASSFYPHLGGVEELVRQLAHAYQKEGDHPVVMTDRWPRTLPSYEEYEGIPVHRLSMRTPDGGGAARVMFDLFHRETVTESIRILQDYGSEVIHVQCGSSSGFYALRAYEELGLPLVVTTQGEQNTEAAGLSHQSEFLATVVERLFAEADGVTACSQSMLDAVADQYGLDLGARSSVITNGVDLAEFEDAVPYQHPRPYVLGIGRLVKPNGLDMLIRAFGEAQTENLDLLIAGEGPEKGSLYDCARDAGKASRIFFMGRAERKLAASLLTGCSFFVDPSRHPSRGIASLEAMAAGKPVIASRAGGNVEVVLDEETGILVLPDDAGSLAEAISRMASDSALREQFGAVGRQRALEFGWPAIAREYGALYDIVCDGVTG